MSEIDPILLKIDKLISISRLKEIAFIIGTDVTERLSKISAVLDGLKAGAYLLGTGPSTVGIIPLTVDEIVLGRSATTLEKPSDVLIDYAASDTLYFMPREVSRAHAKIVRRHNNSNLEFWLVDMGSTCGTYLNNSKIDACKEGTVLSHGDIISLGPSMISTYVFYMVSD